MQLRLLPLGLLSWLLLPQTFALHESDVGVVDWHQQYTGVPLTGSHSTAPVFHRVTTSQGNTQTVILTATDRNVLTALHPGNRSVAWRHAFQAEDHIVHFERHEDTVLALSGIGGANLRAFDALTGELLFEKRLHDPRSAVLEEPSHIGTFLSFAEDASADTFILTKGRTVSYLSSSTGQIKWTWSSPEKDALVKFSRLVTTPTAVYALGLVKAFTTFIVHVTALDPVSGSALASVEIPSNVTEGFSNFFAVKHPKSSAVRLAWLEDSDGSVKSFGLSTTLKGKATTSLKGSKNAGDYEHLRSVGLNNEGLLVAVKRDGSSKVLKVTEDGSALESIWDFEDSADGAHTPSIFAGGYDKKKNPYIARLYWSHPLNLASVELFAPYLSDKGLVIGFSFPFDTTVHGTINHVSIDTANPSEFQIIGRLLLTTSTGAVQLWHQDKYQWTREEALSSIGPVEFVELPEEAVVLSTGRDDEAFVDRLTRQITEAQNLPQYLLRFARRFATGSYASASSSAEAQTTAGVFTRDTFGFRQLIVVATSYGKIFALDTSNGHIVWSRVLGLGKATYSGGGKLYPVKFFTLQTLADEKIPQIALLAQRQGNDRTSDTVVFHFNSLTGEDASAKASEQPTDGLLHGVDILAGPFVDAFKLASTKAIVVLNPELEVTLYPDTRDINQDFMSLAPSLHLPLLMNYPSGAGLTGFKFDSATNGTHVLGQAYPTWSLSLPPTEAVQSIIPLLRGPVASFGKVLGNRTTLYKYLNSRLVVALTTTRPATTCGIYVTDSAKGSVIYRASVPATAGGVCDVKASLTENWLVYHYFDEELTKGYRVVSVELYEGEKEDDKTRSSELSSFSEDIVKIHAHEQSFVFHGGKISAVGLTATKYGISSKALIVATEDNKIHMVSRRLLDPRRPVNRKLTTEEQEEQLIPYDPVIPADPKRVLSHLYDVAGIRSIHTAPTLLESTSLVFASGLDLFLTRVAPSGTFDVLSESFNKLQLVLTVTGLAVGILIVGPIVRRKKLKEKWYE